MNQINFRISAYFQPWHPPFLIWLVDTVPAGLKEEKQLSQQPSIQTLRDLHLFPGMLFSAERERQFLPRQLLLECNQRVHTDRGNMFSRGISRPITWFSFGPRMKLGDIESAIEQQLPSELQSILITKYVWLQFCLNPINTESNQNRMSFERKTEQGFTMSGSHSSFSFFRNKIDTVL